MTNHIQTTETAEGWEAALSRDLDAIGAAERAAAPAGMEARILKLTPGVAMASEGAGQSLRLSGLEDGEASADGGAWAIGARSGRGIQGGWSLRAAAAIALLAGIGAALIAERGPSGAGGGNAVALAEDAEVSRDVDLVASLFEDDAQTELMAVGEEAAAISGRLGGWGESWLEGDAL